nr:MAG TPA: Head Tail Connector Protein [Caudoviricetes sp.]
MHFREKNNKRYPITDSLARQHLRIGDATHDHALIESKLEMAIGIAEDMTNRYICGYDVVFDVLLPVGESIVTLPVYTESVSGIFFSSGMPLPTKDYMLLSSDDSCILVFDNLSVQGMPLLVHANIGYSEASLPAAIKAAILLLLGTLYDNESDQIVGRSVSELSLTAEKLLLPWRINPYGDV